MSVERQPSGHPAHGLAASSALLSRRVLPCPPPLHAPFYQTKQVNEALSARSQRLHELEATLATETVATAKYRKMVRWAGLLGRHLQWLERLR